jgi:hypothetical protein
MKSKISKVNRTIVHNTIERWVQTLTEGTPNIEKAQTCLRAAYENGIGTHRSDRYKKMDVTFHTVQSPLAFMIAVSVARGRMAKRYAETLCRELGIERSFLGRIRKDSLARWNTGRERWWQQTNNEFTRTWLRAVREEYLSREQLVATTNGLMRRWWRNRQNNDSNNVQVAYRTNDLTLVMQMLRSTLNDTTGLDTVQTTSRGWDGRTITNDTHRAQIKQNEIANKAIWDSNTTLSAIGDLRRALDISDLLRPEDSDSTGTVFLGATPKAIDAEILCRMLKIDDPEMTWEHEVFHHCTSFAAFQQSCIILAARPKMHVNEEGNLHNTTGPAVEWSDGTALWFNDGHYMDEGGRTIVEEPQKLSTQHILKIRNEETRRLAIEKFGWDRFIAEADCPVLDRRVNDIDNTIEMLVGPPNSDAQTSRQNRMVLFCRSTGRRYFLGVPRNISSCVEAQAWMADSGNTTRVPYAANPIRLVGAS